MPRYILFIPGKLKNVSFEVKMNVLLKQIKIFKILKQIA